VTRAELSGELEHYEDDDGTHIVVKPEHGRRFHLLVRHELRHWKGRARHAWFILNGDEPDMPDMYTGEPTAYGYSLTHDEALRRATSRALRHLRNYSVERGTPAT
jgi:hypothetical protein